MAEIMLFHHAQGQTEGFFEFADAIRAGGHTVHAPDLYDGRVFHGFDEGMAFANEIGMEALVAKGVAAADGLAEDLVYAGFSLGVLPAQALTQTRSGARGAILIHACVPTAFFGSWPDGVPVQIHAMDADPIFVGEGDIDAVLDLVDSTPDAELFLYPGETHYFADSSLDSYDPTATALLTERVLAFLGRV